MNQPPIGSACLRLDTLALDELAAIGRLILDSLDPMASDSALRRVLTGGEIGRSQLLNQLPENRLAELCSCGLLIASGQRIFSPFRAHRLEGLVIVTDPSSSGQPRSPSYLDPLCEGPQLARLLIRKAVSRGLDMGCGCGVLSLVMSAFCEQVIGVDINPRAVEFSRLNAALNGIGNAAFMESDLFNSVRGEEFDLIVFNSPTNMEGDHYRDLLESGEALLARFFSELGSHLTPDGYCQINLAMNDYRESRFVDRLATWIKAGAKELCAVAMICKRQEWDDGRTWKRGWATFYHGGSCFWEVDWPYHLLTPARPSCQKLSQLVLRLLENHELLGSRKQLPKFTWSEGLCCVLPGKHTLGMWDVPLAEVPDVARLSNSTEPVSFQTTEHLDFWTQMCLRKGLLGVRSDV